MEELIQVTVWEWGCTITMAVIALLASLGYVAWWIYSTLGSLK